MMVEVVVVADVDMDLIRLKQVFYDLLREQHDVRMKAKAAAACFNRDHVALDEKLDVVDKQICEHIQWVEFIKYCNTPCWRFRC